MCLSLLGMMDQAWTRGTSYGACTSMEMAAGVHMRKEMTLPMETMMIEDLDEIFMPILHIFIHSHIWCCATSFFGPGPCIFEIPLNRLFLESISMEESLPRVGFRRHPLAGRNPTPFLLIYPHSSSFRLGFCLVKS